MKDYYRRLGIPPNATPQSVERALATVKDNALRREARAVLLSDRRVAYDLTHVQLARIAQLRTNLGLAHTTLWQGSGAEDFQAAPSGTPSELEKLRTEAGRASAKAPPAAQSGLKGYYLVGLLSLVVVGGWLYLWTLLPGATPPEPDRELTREPTPLPTAPAVETDFGSPVITSLDEVPSIPQIPEAAPLPSVPLPQTGVMARIRPYRDKGPLLRLKTDRATGNVYAKIIDVETGGEAARLFVRQEETATMALPPGSYRVRYAAGSTWYGPEHLFGQGTSIAEADKTFVLTVTETDEGVLYDVQTIELILQSHGNLRTKSIVDSQF